MNKPITGRVERASATKAVDSGSIPNRVKPKTIKTLVFTASLFDVLQLNGQCEASAVCGRQVGARLEDRKIPSLSPGQGNLANKM